EAFRVLDQVLAAANRHGIRLIIPFIDQWSWWGGMAELAAFRGKKLDDCWNDPQLIADYQKIIQHVLNRTNTVTGQCYRDDMAILAWETGNELRAPPAWTRQITAYIRSLDSHHLVVDGTQREVLLESSLEDPNVDFVQTHHYEKDPRDMIEHVRQSQKMARGRKPYHLGEFGFLTTEGLRAVIDTVLEERLSGALLWSLRYRSRDGGFFWHHEPAGGDHFKAYHWPGFESGEKYDERRLMGLVREKAFAIQNLVAPPLPAPASPRLLHVDNGGQMSWQGAVGASEYEVHRAENPEGPWNVVGARVSDAQAQYRPLFVDDTIHPGKSYAYRIVARNAAGSSLPSNVVVARMTHRTLVDELVNDSRIFVKQGKLRFSENEARKFREDCHRLAGEPGSSVHYHASDGISMARVFLFGQSDSPAVRLSYSRDGRQFDARESEVERPAIYGEATYGFWKAALVSARAPGPDYRHVKIEFLTEAQISRVELHHGRVD
ncbi:MAG TPA: hypothetical protein P5055_07140, partial [Candidatus Paceibacterota bacterium]|nr:hypothetical protein [Candidatus Paceibacterota bacterium]